MKRTILCSFSFLLAVLTLFSLFSCAKKERQVEVITEQALPLFNSGVDYFKNNSHFSSARASAVLTGLKDDAPDERTTYLLNYETLYEANGNDALQHILATFVRGDGDLVNKSAEELSYFYDCYIANGYCYYDYGDGDEKIKNAFTSDYHSCLGLYSLSGRSPRSVYAVKEDGEIRVDLTFSAQTAKKSQELFIATMSVGLFGGEIELECSDMTVSAIIDEESGAIERYEIAFTAYAVKKPTAVISFKYAETFTGYGTADQVKLPDLTGFVEMNADQTAF